MPVLSRVHDLLPHIQKNFKGEVLVAGKRKDKWLTYSVSDFVEAVNQTSRGLIVSGIKKGDKVAIMSTNRPEWNICDFAIMQIGATQVPMYPTLSTQDIRFILKDAEIKLVFAGSLELHEKLEQIKKEEGLDVAVFSFEEAESANWWRTITEKGKANPELDLKPYNDAVVPEDLVTLIYTSGTTGTPKGVMLTHANLVSNLVDTFDAYPHNLTKVISFLPLSHIFERMVFYMNCFACVSVYYAESMDTVIADIQDIKPHGFTAVPRVLEKIYDRIVEKGSALTGIKRRLFYWALDLGLRYELYGKNGLWYEFQLAIASKLVFVKWREALGGEIKTLMSGGAALQPRLARVFWAAGIPVLEGYGLTETSPVISLNRLDRNRAMFGTVGQAIKNVEIKIADDGEILCKGPNIMKGYYNRPDLTAEVIDAEGWFHTGDIGEILGEGFLKITDRKKEIFKTAGGKYVAPQLIENKFKESPLIEQVMVVGENRKFPSALVVPNFQALQAWCEKKGIKYSSPAEIIQQPDVIAKYRAELDRYNASFGRWEQAKKFRLLPKEWSIEASELTPKLSLKRKVIYEKNLDLIEQMYADLENGKL
ncbi:MAG: AMP-dependent synthetase/ligase [Sphingobacteriaceae bacterium]